MLPDPDCTPTPSHAQQQQTRSTDQNGYQQQQHQQIQAYQKQQVLAPQQQQTRTPGNFPNSGFRGRLFQTPQNNRNSPPVQPHVPMPMQPGPMQGLHNVKRPQGMQNVNLAAQALVHQQLFNQAARARFMAQAQLLQQQPHVSDFIQYTNIISLNTW